jgi:hypothetical protein
MGHFFIACFDTANIGFDRNNVCRNDMKSPPASPALPCSLMHAVFRHMEVINVMVKHWHDNWLNCNAKTKCLNTGVIICILVLGTKFFETCENDHVNAMSSKYRRRSAARVKTLVKQLTADRAYSQFFYVIFTDGEFVCNTNSKSNVVFFPGHIFVIEKLPHMQGFLVFQSFINEYEPGDIDKGCRYFDHADMLQVCDVMHSLYSGTQPTWDARLRKNFAAFTGVETSRKWLSCKHSTHLDFRYMRLARGNVYTNIFETIRTWQDAVRNQPEKLWDCDDASSWTSQIVMSKLNMLLQDVRDHHRVWVQK